MIRLAVSCATIVVAFVAPLPGQHARRTPPPGAAAMPGSVRAQQKISNFVPGFLDTLDPDDEFGRAVCGIGDVDGDGNDDLAASSVDPTGFEQPGAIYVLFLADDGSVRAYRKLDAYHAPLAGEVDLAEFMGSALAPLGDFDGDGVPDLASFSPRAPDPSGFAGPALRLLFLARDGSVRAHATNFELGGHAGHFSSLANLGDLDGDGIVELALGRQNEVSILFLATDGSTRSLQVIGRDRGGFVGTPDAGFGSAVADLGDLDGNGVGDLAVGANGTAGAVWVLLLGADGTVRSQHRLLGPSPGGIGGFGSALAAPGDLNGDGRSDLAVGVANEGLVWVYFLAADGSSGSPASFALPGTPGFGGPGTALAALADLDGDGGTELAVGAPGDDEDGRVRGAVYVLSLHPGAEFGQVTAKISDRPGSLEGTLDDVSHFGSAVTLLGDLDGNGAGDLAVGARGDAIRAGAVWILFLRRDGTVQLHRKIATGVGGFTGMLADGDSFGAAIEGLGDVDGDGTPDLAVGAPRNDAGGRDRGSVHVLFLRPDGTVKTHQEISSRSGSFRGPLSNDDLFGSSLTCLGDIDRDGTPDLAVGAPGDDDGGTGKGAVWLLSLRRDGTVATTRKISATEGGFSGVLAARDGFGSAVESLGDVDGDGHVDLAVGASAADGGGTDHGAVWVLFLDSGGAVKAQQSIGSADGGFGGVLRDGDGFGSALATLDDLDLDGVNELVVGAPLDDDGGNGTGAAWVLFLGADGRVLSHRKLGAALGGFMGTVAFTHFGSALARLGDRDGDGVPDLVAGAPFDFDGGLQHGALWLLSLDGLAHVGFEQRDAQPLVNGQSLAPVRMSTWPLQVTGAGANLGPAAFDSRSSGPNAAGPDRDLLVGKGNVLVLQNSRLPKQSVAGIFDRPNDDEDGGVVAFSFHTPIAPLSLDLVDIDLQSPGAVSVTLVDAAGRLRLYAVPPGWTEDLLVSGGPAWRRLDLTTLASQKGFASTATGTEAPGFAPDAVVRIEVELPGSGALDELRWDPHP